MQGYKVMVQLDFGAIQVFKGSYTLCKTNIIIIIIKKSCHF